MKDILKYGILVGLWAVLILPFFVANGMFFPYITGKNFAFRIIVEIIFALYLILAINYKEYRPKFSWVLISVTAFTLIMFIADIFAVAPMKALWSNFERMDGFVTLIHLWAYLVVFGTVMKSEDNWLWFFRFSVVTSVFMALKTLFGTEAEALTRISGPLGNPIYLGVYFLFNLFFVLFLLYKDVIRKNMIGSWGIIRFWLRDWRFYAYVVVVFLNFWGIWKTQTRGVILGLIGGLLVTLIASAILERKESVLKRISIIKIIAIIIIIGAFFAVKDMSFVKSNPTLSRLSAISWSNISGQGQARQYVWPMAIKGFVEKPILGWGQDGFNYVFNKYYDPRMYGQESWFDRAHNMPLDMLVAGGILGLISYLAIFLSSLYVLWKSKREVFEKALILGLLAAYFFQNLFVFDNLVSYFLFFTVLSYLYFTETSGSLESEKRNGYEMSEDLKKILAIIIVCMLGFTLWWVNVRPIKANLYLINAMTAQEYSLKDKKIVSITAEQTMDYFKKALSYNTFANPEIREQILNIAQKVAYSNTGIKDETKIDYLNFAIAEMDKQIVQTPNDARYQIFTGSLLNNLGRSDLALPYLEKAKELSINKQTIAFELIQGYMGTGEREKARDEAKRVYELGKSIEKSKAMYASTLIVTGNEKGALELLGGVKSADESITNAYVMVAVDKYKKGQLAQAVAEINKAIGMNPSFDTTGKQLIDQIWTKTLNYE